MSFRLSFELKDDFVSTLSILLEPKYYRITGRSSIMAKAFIVISYRNPYEWITLIDHLHHKQISHRRHMLDRVYDYVNYDYIENRFKDGVYQIKYIPKIFNEPLDVLFKNPDIVENFNLHDYYRQKHILR